MDFERVDSFPEFNLFFSPNWYSHQIADISPSGLCALGCNDEVQLIDLYARRPITSLYIKTPQNDKFINDINERKVTAVLVTDKFIVFSTVSGYLTIFEISNNNIICKFCDCVLANVQISTIKELKPEDCELELLLTDNKNKIIFAKYKDGMVDQLNLERQGNNHATKCIEILDYKDEQFYAKVMDNGTFNIWTSYFEDAVFNVDIGHIINTASFGIFDGLMIVSLISRQNRVIICQVGLEKVLDDFLEERKFVHTNGNNFRLLVNLELIVETPFLPASSLNKIKLRFHNRIISMNDQRIILTSKDGNMYLTDIESLMKVKEDSITMKPAAYEENENPYYEMLDENPHFKNIYFAKLIGETFLAIGMDRLVSYWRINEYRIQYDFNIKCLGSKVTSVAVSPLDPSTYLMSCNDNTMRLWNTAKKTNRFITTILWKGLDKKRIKQIVFHPQEESIVALESDKDICLMDIHAHTVIKEFKIGELYDGEPAYAQWVKRNQIEKLIDSKFESCIKKMIKKNKGYKQFLKGYKHNNAKITSKFRVVNQKYQKDIDPNYLFLTYIINKGFIIADYKLGTVFCMNYNLEKFISSVQLLEISYLKDSLFIFFGDKKGNLICIRGYKNEYDYVFIHNYHTALIYCIQPNLNGQPENQFLLATGSYDRTIKISQVYKINSSNFGNQNFKTLHIFKHKFRIQSIDWDPFNPHRFLNTCQKHVTVQVWTIDPKQQTEDKDRTKVQKDSKDQYYVANIRGHKGFITDATWSRSEKDTIMTCSDDQSVKIWNLVNIKYKKPPGKQKKESKLGEMIVEEQEELSGDEKDNHIDSERFQKFTTGKKKKKNYQNLKQIIFIINGQIKYKEQFLIKQKVIIQNIKYKFKRTQSINSLRDLTYIIKLFSIITFFNVIIK